MRLSRLFYVLLLLIVLVPTAANSTGSLTIPNTIAAQPAGNLQASLLDTNWSAIATYVNARQITFDILGNRPAAGTAGRFYLSTDTDGGTYYADNGSAWVQLSAGVTSAGAGSYAIRGANWSTATTTNTTYNGTADLVILRNPTTGALVTRRATTTVSNNVLTAGPAANGRDRSTAFTVSTWVHFYYIWNGSSLDTVSTSCAPSDATGVCPTVGGPVLPTGYTHWAYIGPARFATTGILNATWIQGSLASIEPVTHRACAAGTGAEQSYSIEDRTPPNNLGTRVHLIGNANGVQGEVRALSGGRVVLNTNFGGAALGTTASLAIVPVGQTLFFLGNAGGSFCLQTSGYRIPNGGD